MVTLCYFFQFSPAESLPEIKLECEVKKLASVEDLLSFLKLLDLSLGTLKLRLERGDFCYLAFIEGKAVHRSWVTFSSCWVKDARAVFKPAKNEAYIYDSYTLPRYRSKGAFTSTLLKIIADFRGSNTSLWIAVRENNFPSRKAVEKVGFEKVFGLMFKKILVFKRYEFVKIRENFSEKGMKDRIILA